MLFWIASVVITWAKNVWLVLGIPQDQWLKIWVWPKRKMQGGEVLLMLAVYVHEFQQ